MYSFGEFLLSSAYCDSYIFNLTFSTAAAFIVLVCIFYWCFVIITCDITFTSHYSFVRKSIDHVSGIATAC